MKNLWNVTTETRNKFKRLAKKYERLPPEQRPKADAVLEMLDRDLDYQLRQITNPKPTKPP